MDINKKHSETDLDCLGNFDESAYLSEINDIKTSFIRKKVPEPNVDFEWDKFRANKMNNLSTNSKPLAWLLSGLVIGGVAATIVCLLALWPLIKEKEKSITIFKAVSQDHNIEMTTSYAQNEIGGKCTIKDANNLRKSSVNVTTLDMRDNSVSNDDNLVNYSIEERTIVTPRGKELKILLNDGSEVLLHAESKLRFPIKFYGDTRTVFLEGEAYFTIAKDQQHPFIVISQQLNTTAIGTEFNVRAYEKNNVRVTLVDGSVSVEDMINTNKVILSPGEDVCSINGKLIVSDVDTKSFSYWKEGFFYFDNIPLIDVMVELGRWYNVNVELKRRSLMSYRLHFVADRNSSLNDAIERLNHFSYINVELKG
jgi:Fe2+-dicitrate sensor, membrane component